MATVRVNKSEVACGKGSLRVGALVIDPTTGIVCGRCQRTYPPGDPLEDKVDIWVDDARVGEVMTHLRSPMLSSQQNDNPNVRPARPCARANTEVREGFGTVWNVCYVHGGIGFVGTGTNLRDAFQHLVDQCPEVVEADVAMLSEDRRNRVGFDIHVKCVQETNRAYNATQDLISYQACIAGSWNGQVGSGLTAEVAIEDLKRKSPGWDLSGQVVAVDSMTQRLIIPKNTRAVVLAMDRGFQAHWAESLCPDVFGESIQSPGLAVQQLICTSQRAGKTVFSLFPNYKIVSQSGRPFVVEMIEQEDGQWAVRVRDWKQAPIQIQRANRTGAMEALHSAYPDYEFAERYRTVTAPRPPRTVPEPHMNVTGPMGASAPDYIHAAFVAGMATRSQGVTLTEAMRAMGTVPPAVAERKIPVVKSPNSDGPSRSRRIVEL